MSESKEAALPVGEALKGYSGQIKEIKIRLNSREEASTEHRPLEAKIRVNYS